MSTLWRRDWQKLSLLSRLSKKDSSYGELIQGGRGLCLVGVAFVEWTGLLLGGRGICWVGVATVEWVGL